jgi:hypothetical protein
MTHSGSPRSVCVCEPMCEGFEHGAVNAAILHAILLAFPEAEITFAAEAEHCERVHTNLSRANPGSIARIRWEAISIAPRLTSSARRLPFEFRTLRQIFGIALDQKADLVFFTSATELGLLALKILLLVRRRPFRVMAILHNVLTSFETVQRKRFSRFRGLPAVFTLPQPSGFRCITLGESIFSHLQAVHPGAARYFDVLDLPCEWATSTPSQVSAVGSAKFGFLGVSRGKAFQTFARVVEGVRTAEPSVRFSLVGHLNSAEDCARYKGITEDAECAPLSDEEYRRRGLDLTYTVWTAEPSHYGLVASATFLDALSLVKPCIYLRNPYIDSYASRMGDIGYGCTSVQEMQDLIVSLVRSFPSERYKGQCATILRTRNIFSPQTVGQRLRELVLRWNE